MFGRIKSSECASNELFFVCGSVPDQERARYPHFSAAALPARPMERPAPSSRYYSGFIIRHKFCCLAVNLRRSMQRERVVHLNPANTQSASKQEKSKPDNHHRFKPQHLQRPKSFAPAKLGQERRSHGHDSINHLNPSVNRRATGLAL